jgi:hypothetical protein
MVELDYVYGMLSAGDTTPALSGVFGQGRGRALLPYLFLHLPTSRFITRYHH